MNPISTKEHPLFYLPKGIRSSIYEFLDKKDFCKLVSLSKTEVTCYPTKVQIVDPEDNNVHLSINIKTLYFTAQKTFPEFVKMFSQLPKIRTVYFDNSWLQSPRELASLLRAKTLNTLFLKNAGFREKEDPQQPHPPLPPSNITTLDISHPMRTNSEVLLFQNFPLHTLKMGGCSKVDEETISQMLFQPNLKGLRVLDIAYCQKISPVIFSRICALPNLRVLDLSGHLVTKNFSEIQQLKKLSCIILRWNKNLTHQELQHMQKLPFLHVLDLSQNTITDEMFSCLKDFQNLRHLKFSIPEDPKRTEQIIEKLKELKHLHSLSIDDSFKIDAETLADKLSSLPSLRSLTIDIQEGEEIPRDGYFKGIPTLRTLVLKNRVIDCYSGLKRI